MKLPFINKPDLDKIIGQHPTPFHLYYEKGIRETARKLKQAFSWNKGYKEYFAVKATPNPYIMKILLEEGFGLDCSSLTELMLSEKVGAKGNDIMFSSNATPDEDYLLASKMGSLINLDDYTHIEILERLAGIPKTVCCRYNPGGEFKTSETGNVMDTPRDAKYGFTHEQIIDGYRLLKEKGAEQFGMHAFLASNTMTNDYYPVLAETMFRAAVEIKEKSGVTLSFINLSGGIGIPYHPDQKENDILEIGRRVKEAYDRILVPAGMGDVAIYTELGRYVLGPHAILVTTAIREKHIHKEYIGLDACAANLMRPAIYGSYHHITVMGKEDAPHNHKYDITGGLCENNDKFAIDRMLPKIEMGDIVVLHDTGAHGFSMGYNYNGKLLSAEVLYKEDGTAELIRRAETPEDYFSTFDFSKEYSFKKPCC